MVKIPNKKEEKSLRDAAMPPLPFAHHVNEEEDKPKEEIVTVDQAVEKIKEMQKFCDEVNNQIREIYDQMGWEPKFLKTFLSNPNNFSPAEWEMINETQKEMMQSFMLPEELEIAEQTAKEKEKKKEFFQEVPSEEKRKKGKPRRNWLPMR